VATIDARKIDAHIPTSHDSGSSPGYADQYIPAEPYDGNATTLSTNAFAAACSLAGPVDMIQMC